MLNLPDSTETHWFSILGGLIGPIGAAGPFTGNSISKRSSLDSISGGKAIYHENDVLNKQVEAYVTYVPIMGMLEDRPTTNQPDRISFDSYQYGRSRSKWLFNLGLTYDGLVSYERDSSQSLNYGWYMSSAYDFYIVRIQCLNSNPKLVTKIEKFEYKFSRLDLPNGVLYTKGRTTTWQIPNGRSTSFSCTQRLTIEQINSLLYGTSTTGGWSEQVRTDYTSGEVYDVQPSALFTTVDALVMSALNPVEYPIPDRHYGDLAMEAAAQTNANSVNMIAFLRDLRDPKSMIPKLKNLKKLKTHASNYLAVNYGILPTISDLQTIFGAFKRIKPYVDRNGFKTYNAGYTDHTEVGSISFQLTQRIKLAIEDEDDGFQKLIGALDSIGLYPTLENIWDLIPYSFVLDWFVNVGGFLERVDTRLRLIRLNIRYATMSRRSEVSMPLYPSVRYPYVGSISQVHYQRWVSDQCPVPPAFAQSTFQGFSHWLESAALITQRVKTRR